MMSRLILEVDVTGDQPGNIDLQNTGEQLCHIAPRNRLAAHILAHLTLAEFFAEHLRCTDYVRLADVAIGHSLSQAIAKRLLGHRNLLAGKVQFIEHELNQSSI